MDKEKQDRKKFLIEQIEWCKKQDATLEEIEKKLYQMKELAQYALVHDLNSVEIEKLNGQLKELTMEVYVLENQLKSIVH